MAPQPRPAGPTSGGGPAFGLLPAALVGVAAAKLATGDLWGGLGLVLLLLLGSCSPATGSEQCSFLLARGYSLLAVAVAFRDVLLGMRFLQHSEHGINGRGALLAAMLSYTVPTLLLLSALGRDDRLKRKFWAQFQAVFDTAANAVRAVWTPEAPEVAGEACCRVCLEHGDLVRPCGCRGSQAYVHAECLWRWREQSASRARCELCGCCFTVAGPATAEARAAALLAAGLLGVVTVDVALLVLEVCGLSVPQVTRCARFTPAWRRGIESLWQACDADGDGGLSVQEMRHLANVTGEAAVANMTDDALQAVIGLVRHNDRGLTAAGLVQTYEYGSDVAVVLRNDLAAFGLLAVAQHRYGDVCHSLVAAAAYSALLAARRLRGHASARWLLAAGLPAVACSLRTSALRCPMVTVLLALLGVLWLMCSTTCRADLPEIVAGRSPRPRSRRDAGTEHTRRRLAGEMHAVAELTQALGLLLGAGSCLWLGA